MKRGVLLRLDFFEGSGSGHLRRCLALAGALQTQGFNPRLVVDDVSALPRDLEFDADQVPFTDTFDEALDAVEVANLAQKYGANCVIGDSYRISGTWVQMIKDSGPSVVLIDDLNIGANADIAINYTPGAKAPSSFEGRAYLGGPEYFLSQTPRLSSRFGAVKTIVAHAGGTGNFAAASGVYLATADAAKQAGLKVTWICPNSTAQEWLTGCGVLDGNSEVQSWQEGNAVLWQDFDLVVGPSSTSLFEAIMQGTLPVSFPISASQSEDRLIWNKLGHVMHLTQKEAQDFAVARDIINLAIENRDVLRSALDSSAATLDGQGAHRVAERIAALGLQSFPVMPEEAEIDGSGIRPCTMCDAGAFLEARNASRVRDLSTNPKHQISWPEHLFWWLRGTTERFVVEAHGSPEAFFWHREEHVDGRDYLIGGWFPASDNPMFATAIRLLDWQLQYTKTRFPDHIWLATINRRNTAVVRLNRRMGFEDANARSREAARQLFPGTTDAFEILQRKTSA